MALAPRQPLSPLALRIAVVGDVHEAWDAQDAIALRALDIDLVLFVGDFGNESVPVVRQISQLSLPMRSPLATMMLGIQPPPGGPSKPPTIAAKPIG